MALSGRLRPPPGHNSSAAIASVDGSAVIHPSATVERGVLVGRGANIGADCRIIGPSVVGEGCGIGAGSVVRECVLLPGTQIPSGTHVHRRLIGPDSSIEELQEGDSGAQQPF